MRMKIYTSHLHPNINSSTRNWAQTQSVVINCFNDLDSGRFTEQKHLFVCLFQCIKAFNANYCVQSTFSTFSARTGTAQILAAMLLQRKLMLNVHWNKYIQICTTFMCMWNRPEKNDKMNGKANEGPPILNRVTCAFAGESEKWPGHISCPSYRD